MYTMYMYTLYIYIYHPANGNVTNNKGNRKRNVIWFNLPFSKVNHLAYIGA